MFKLGLEKTQEPESSCQHPLGHRENKGIDYAKAFGEGNDNPFQYSFLENSMERGTWQATVHGVAKSWT